VERDQRVDITAVLLTVLTAVKEERDRRADITTITKKNVKSSVTVRLHHLLFLSTTLLTTLLTTHQHYQVQIATRFVTEQKRPADTTVVRVERDPRVDITAVLLTVLTAVREERDRRADITVTMTMRLVVKLSVTILLPLHAIPHLRACHISEMESNSTIAVLDQLHQYTRLHHQIQVQFQHQFQFQHPHVILHLLVSHISEMESHSTTAVLDHLQCLLLQFQFQHQFQHHHVIPHLIVSHISEMESHSTIAVLDHHLHLVLTATKSATWLKAELIATVTTVDTTVEKDRRDLVLKEEREAVTTAMVNNTIATKYVKLFAIQFHLFHNQFHNQFHNHQDQFQFQHQFQHHHAIPHLIVCHISEMESHSTIAVPSQNILSTNVISHLTATAPTVVIHPRAIQTLSVPDSTVATLQNNPRAIQVPTATVAYTVTTAVPVIHHLVA